MATNEAPIYGEQVLALLSRAKSNLVQKYGVTLPRQTIVEIFNAQKDFGVRTFGWTFANRKQPPPGAVPYVRLTAPSGAIWEWNAPSAESAVEGDGVEFCQVVTQTRGVGDTSLRVVGDVARQWMALAQCFAGPPNDPPAKGTRFAAKN